jgi:hypothetical protein
MIDFTVRGVAKGSALREWRSENGIDQHDVAAIGDSTADVPMLRWAGVSRPLPRALPRPTGRFLWPEVRSDDDVTEEPVGVSVARLRRCLAAS